MNFLGIIGSNKSESYAKKVLDYASFLLLDEIFIDQVSLEAIPIFSRDLDIKNYENLLDLADRIKNSDGIIIAYEEKNNTLVSQLKSLLEWLSFDLKPFIAKPVLLLGLADDGKAPIMAQMHLKEILTSPGLETFVMPGSDFIMTRAKDMFDQDGRLIDEKSQDFLEHCLMRFKKYAQMINELDLDKIESKYLITLRAGGYINLDDPFSDGTSGATDY
ncbi:MAG: NAD(P)H-dependent oxidoreductase [Tissierellia bacterium]|nr:NAD(P)H-dependent oxidoreductase [Tissierellia bacterium]